MRLTSVVLQVAGFLLAHGAERVSEQDQPAILKPFGMTVTDGKQELLQFSAYSIEQALAEAKQKFEEQKSKVDACAIMYESYKMSKAGEESRYFNVEAWEKDMDVALKVVQVFQPADRDQKLKIIGDPLIFIDNAIVTDEKNPPLLGFIYSGLVQHPGGKLWNEWKSKM